MNTYYNTGFLKDSTHVGVITITTLVNVNRCFGARIVSGFCLRFVYIHYYIASREKKKCEILI